MTSGRKQATIGNGERSSAATSYLPAPVRERPNLSILLNTYITRVVPTDPSSEALDIRTIEIAPRAGGERFCSNDRSSKDLLAFV